MMKKPTVEFCMLNIGNHSNKAKETLEKEQNVQMATFGCLKKCSVCFKHQYALVDGEIVIGDTSEQLVENVYQQIKAVTVK